MMKLRMKIPGELKLLHQRIHAFAQAARVPMGEASKLAAFYYLQSAATITPQAKKKRPITTGRNPRGGNIYYVNTYKKGGNGAKVRRPFFKQAQANKYTRLDSWGMGKSGWWLASNLFSSSYFSSVKPFRKPAGRIIQKHAADLSRVLTESGITSAVEVTNNAPRIRNMFGGGLDALAIGKASNRLNQSMKQELKKQNKTIS